jgi:DNA ligase (NAD+)
MSVLKNKSICITGTLQFMTREDAVKDIERAGGTFSKSVSSTTNYLVIADTPGATKVKAAKKWGTAKLTEKEFLAILKKVPKADLFEVKTEPEPESSDMTLGSRDW